MNTKAQESSLTLLQSSNQAMGTPHPPDSLLNASQWYNGVTDPRIRGDYDYCKFIFTHFNLVITHKRKLSRYSSI